MVVVLRGWGVYAAVAAWTLLLFFFFNDTATTEIYTLSLHDALPICRHTRGRAAARHSQVLSRQPCHVRRFRPRAGAIELDRKSTRLNSSHSQISYAVFCLKKKNASPDA